MLLNFHILVNFLNFLLLLMSYFIPLYLENFVWFWSFKIYWDLFCGLTYGLSRRMFSVPWRRMLFSATVGWRECPMDVHWVSLVCSIESSNCFFHCWMWSIQFSMCYCWTVSSSHWLFLLRLLWCSVLGLYMFIIFLLDWPFIIRSELCLL